MSSLHLQLVDLLVISAESEVAAVEAQSALKSENGVLYRQTDEQISALPAPASFSAF